MKQQEFEARVLSLWTETRVPLTRANLLAATKVPRAQMDRWLDEMVRARLLELDSDDDGELLWKVRGSARPARGAQTVGDMGRLSQLSAEVEKLSSGANIALRAVGLKTESSGAGGAEKKSLVASGALSFFFGPVGWLYAAPLKEAIPAIIVYIPLYYILSILPTFLFGSIMGVVNILSALAGLLYAWSYNREGRRAPLLLKDDPPPALRGKR